MQTVIYTTLFGDYDRLVAPLVGQSARLVCVSDRPRAALGWEVMVVPRRFADATRAAKWYKILCHKAFPDAERSVYLDANFPLTTDLGHLFSDKEMVLFEHPLRDCIYAEADICRLHQLDDPWLITQQVRRYRRLGVPRHAGLYVGGLLFRQHTTAVNDAMERWWREIFFGSRRDQLSLPWVVGQSEIDVTVLPAELRSHYVGELRPHTGARQPAGHTPWRQWQSRLRWARHRLRQL